MHATEKGNTARIITYTIFPRTVCSQTSGSKGEGKKISGAGHHFVWGCTISDMFRCDVQASWQVQHFVTLVRSRHNVQNSNLFSARARDFQRKRAHSTLGRTLPENVHFETSDICGEAISLLPPRNVTELSCVDSGLSCGVKIRLKLH